MPISSYSSKELFDFLEWAKTRNVVKRNTVDSWKTAAQRVLEALDASEQEDLRELDLEDALSRFENRAGRNYKPESLRVYRSRFAIVLDQFFKWKANPSAYKPERRSKKSNALAPSGRKKMQRIAVSASEQSIPTVMQDAPSESWMLPIPLRQGVLVKIFGLPTDLSQAEARKLSAVITALATEEAN